MSRRAHLHQLARELRRYLAWQKVEGATHFVPADDEERSAFEARKQAAQEQKLDDLRSKLAGDESTKVEADSAEPTGSTRPSTEDGDESAGDSASFDPTDTSPSDSTEDSQKQTDQEGVTASTPLWKRHESLRELKAGQNQSQQQAGGSRQSANPSKRSGNPDATTNSRAATFGKEPETPSEKLKFLRQYLGDCQRCPLHQGRTNVVFGDGNSTAQLMFIGEGPGRHEDRQGLPFVGKSGQLLTKMIGAMGLQRDEVYITNVVKCRPPGNRNPAPLEIKECSPFLKKQIEVIEPEVIVTLGKFASNTLLDEDEALGRLRGQWHEHMGIPVMPTYHPAYLLRNEDNRRFKHRSWNDLKMVMERLGLDGE